MGNKLVTDISIIEALAEEREEENWEFRRFLKNSDLEIEKIDAIVHRLYREVAKGIACLECGHCCRVASPILSPEDVSRLAEVQGMTDEAFTEQYLIKDEAGMLFRLPCPFQSGHTCTVYEHRPENCRSFPHLHKPDFVFHLVRAIENCSVCPISFNVYERLKQEIYAGVDRIFGQS